METTGFFFGSVAFWYYPFKPAGSHCEAVRANVIQGMDLVYSQTKSCVDSLQFSAIEFSAFCLKSRDRGVLLQRSVAIRHSLLSENKMTLFSLT